VQFNRDRIQVEGVQVSSQVMFRLVIPIFARLSPDDPDRANLLTVTPDKLDLNLKDYTGRRERQRGDYRRRLAPYLVVRCCWRGRLACQSSGQLPQLWSREKEQGSREAGNWGPLGKGERPSGIRGTQPGTGELATGSSGHGELGSLWDKGKATDRQSF